jgi:hypothetical protein
MASFERRFAKGLSFNVNSTWAHGIDDAVAWVSGNAAYTGYGAVPNLISTLDRGNGDLDIRFRVAGTVSYQLPFGANLHGISGALGKGWQVNMLAGFTSGSPFSVVNVSNISNTRPGQTGGDRPNQIGNPNGPRTLKEWFNTEAFAAQEAGTIGALANSGATPGTIGSYYEKRNQMHGPNYRHIDFSVFNVANMANFSNPNASLGGSNYGEVTSMSLAYIPRQIQFAMKLQF